ncbi:MAG TPA: pyruvate dehydrogenase (acetyl-transferring), homodimeric type [Phycisphaerae bacterium]|nr:pyruvate dehydrogenase (acetyl-transferring), homodimeric type [Phycisphaerae bacterium]
MLRASNDNPDIDSLETSEWIESLDAVVRDAGPQRAAFLLARLGDWAQRHGVRLPYSANTPYVNTIPRAVQPKFPGDRKIEWRIKSYARWNAMAMVVRANQAHEGLGGHISTYASAATLLEMGFNHFFRARTPEHPGDQVFFQGHSAPGIYARAFLEGRLQKQQLVNFRRELAKGRGLSSYPHPWLMPDFWEFPTVSMGLSPITSIYQARFNEYLLDRGLLDTRDCRVWAFLGDGEMDEPESLGAITLATREHLDNLTWVVNCNLQRLDGPVRGNGNIIQELEAAFTGAGWNVVKLIWGSDWDPLFEADRDGALIEAFQKTVDGQFQRYTVEKGAYTREHFFGRDPRTFKLVEHMTDGQIEKMRLGGHDPEKVYAAYKLAAETKGRPTVILARTIKGYGLGEAGEGRNVTHQQKKLNEDELREFRDRFQIPISDAEIKRAPFRRFDEGSVEFEYLLERRRALGGFVPARQVSAVPMPAPPLELFGEFLEGSGESKASTTMVYMRMLNRLMRDKQFGKLIVPIVPDEARTFGMEALFRSYGIYAHAGQLYEPVDHATLLRYEERRNGQILEEGITEAGSMASFTAAGSAYATYGINMIPFYTFYSMFGFQRIGDSIWAAGDLRCKGFLIGATAGRTTLNGEGLQHQDGHSHLLASTVPNCISYDPAFAFELALIIRDGVRRMYEDQESVFYYITVYNETYEQPKMPEGAAEGVLKGMYKFRAAEDPGAMPRVHLFGSGPIVREALRAQEMLRERYQVAADVWSITSYTELYRDGLRCSRWNRLHPTEPPRIPHINKLINQEPWPIVAASDYVKSNPFRVQAWCPASFFSLGTDGFGRSETREDLRRFFEIDAEHIAFAALTQLSRIRKFDAARLPKVIKDLGIDPEAPDPALA